jgi:hypothetical protein
MFHTHRLAKIAPAPIRIITAERFINLITRCTNHQDTIDIKTLYLFASKRRICNQVENEKRDTFHNQVVEESIW